MMEKFGNFILRIMLVFLLILILFDVLDWFSVIHSQPGGALSDLGNVYRETGLPSVSLKSLEPFVWLLFDVYGILKTAGLFVFGISGLGSVIWILFSIVWRLAFKGSIPFLFPVKMAVLSFLGFLCSVSGVVQDMIVSLF